ncbi:hypothetical protein ILUMI_19772 [Ignelater luminosus]|uniref:Uncharacterized protein n=1 Tax=Ignelater luminosus TaxID=2038154 RepID=A0A8K0CIM8_IGNLU|nr:hypothetical protein ILUMI_19772 [Ignelater luminosus]
MENFNGNSTPAKLNSENLPEDMANAPTDMDAEDLTAKDLTNAPFERFEEEYDIQNITLDLQTDAEVKKPYTTELIYEMSELNNKEEEIQQLADTFCTDLESDVEPYEDSGSEYLASEHCSSESDLEPPKKFSSDFESNEEDDALQNIPPSNPPANKRDFVAWDDVDDQCIHLMKIPNDKACITLADLKKVRWK